MSSDLPTYRQGDTVRLTVEARDENGVVYAGTAAFLEEEGADHSDPRQVPSERTVNISGSPEEVSTHVEIVMDGTIDQQLPGVYVCYAIVAENRHGALSRHELDPPRRFRIVEHPDDVREGPEVLSVGVFR